LAVGLCSQSAASRTKISVRVIVFHILTAH